LEGTLQQILPYGADSSLIKSSINRQERIPFPIGSHYHTWYPLSRWPSVSDPSEGLAWRALGLPWRWIDLFRPVGLEWALEDFLVKAEANLPTDWVWWPVTLIGFSGASPAHVLAHEWVNYWGKRPSTNMIGHIKKKKKKGIHWTKPHVILRMLELTDLMSTFSRRYIPPANIYQIMSQIWLTKCHVTCFCISLKC
jgi:hypothetical protein